VGVPISAIIFGGRRAKTAPLVYQSADWQNGVFIGSIMASETTAAAAGAVGVVRRDPMAMLPFCGYNMGEYFGHWLEMGKKLADPPKIFNVNWFRLDDKGKFIWPGYGDNMRVLLWILARCEDKIGADVAPIGFLPRPEDVGIEGLPNITLDTMRELFRVDPALWREEAAGIRAFYEQFEGSVPAELFGELEKLESALR
jgi:phosphoenolpyruvate carboxykinase (GTP)